MRIILALVMVVSLMSTAALAGAPPLALTVPTAGTATQTLTLTVPDIKGSYTIPYLQSEPELRLSLTFPTVDFTRARVTLRLGKATVATKTVLRARPRTHFPGLVPGEYSLQVEGLDAAGQVLGSATWERVGIGTVLCAIGDSITEGYHGHWFWRDDLNLNAAVFPPEAVSHDGRNFPQYSPTTSYHRPEVNCFQSWMTDLNNSLSAAWGQPVYVANEGVGGITSGAYLSTVRGDTGWQHRMALLRPTVWLIHLGVNDERHNVTPADYAANMSALVEELVTRYQARRERILIARPCYDYAHGMADVEAQYIRELDKLIPALRVSPGPDFFAAYGVDKARWYGADPVHPNIPGMEYMARLWHEALLRALPKPSAGAGG